MIIEIHQTGEPTREIRTPSYYIDILTPGIRGNPGPQGATGAPGVTSLSSVNYEGPISYNTSTNTLKVHQDTITDGGNF